MSPGSVSAAVDRIGELALDNGFRVAAAESLTSGCVLAELGKGRDASDWFAGGVVAYLSEVKYDVLGVDRGPVITPTCAMQMAEGVGKLTGATASVATTGVGGPEAEEGHPPGTVFIAVRVGEDVAVEGLVARGDPTEVVEETVQRAVEMLLGHIEASLP